MSLQRVNISHGIGGSGLPRSLLWLTVLAGSLALGGCGDDAPSSSPPPKKPATAVKKQNPRQRGADTSNANKGGLQFYAKVEDFTADPEEAKRIRHPFAPRDFEPDITGDENRDPFRSYVIQQPGVSGQQGGGQQPATPSDLCSSKNLVAPNYSLRDLRLVGIVLRGTSSYALFRDSASYGHIVRKGDCLGQEKARVAAIRTGFVSLEVIPDGAPTSPDRPTQERAIQLYPEELTIEPAQ